MLSALTRSSMGSVQRVHISSRILAASDPPTDPSAESLVGAKTKDVSKLTPKQIQPARTGYPVWSGTKQ